MANESLPWRRVKAHLASLLKCPFCNDVYREAMTINECMHTFCMECIYQKLQTEGITSCPTCNVDLSHLSPEDYLRPNENLRNLIRTCFDDPPRSNEQVETVPQATPPSSITVTTSTSSEEEEEQEQEQQGGGEEEEEEVEEEQGEQGEEEEEEGEEEEEQD